MAERMDVRRPRRRSENYPPLRAGRGYTLAGVVAAVSVLGISVLGAQEFLGSLSRPPAADPHQMMAAEFAQAELADLRALDAHDLASRTTSAKLAGTDYTIASRVTDGHGAEKGTYIHTTVSWLDDRGMPQHYSLEAAHGVGTP